MGRPNKLIDKLIAAHSGRARKDIQAWRSALAAAENPENPKRTLLYNLYDELCLDDQFIKESQFRKLNLISSEFGLFDAEGVEQPELSKMFKKKWFYDFLNLSLESIFYGHSLMQVEDLVDGEISGVKLINRKHVIPEKGLFLIRATDDKGIAYRDDPSYYDWLLEYGDNNDLGLLNKIAPFVLYKRFALSAWSEFCEVFGMPLRFAKTNVKDTESLNRVENMLINMATASYAVIDNEEDLNFVESNKTDGLVYDNLIKRCNAAISKIIISTVIGEDSQGGSLSKEEVGERTTNKIYGADKLWREMYINSILLPKLAKYGYKLEGYEFKFRAPENLDFLWKITSGLLPHKEVDNDYITKTFGIPVANKALPSGPAEKEKLSFF